MTSDRNKHDTDPVDPLALALEKSHEVKAKVEAVADVLATGNDEVRQKMAAGATTLPAAQALQDNQRVEADVQQCADDMHGVTDSLARGINDLEQVELALAHSREALATTAVALSTALAEERKATMRALHDAATGLPNRALFDDRLAHGIAIAERHGWSLAVMFLDLVHFKRINDDHGHAVGDGVLVEVARRLSASCREEDTICRNGGDEFLYLFMDPQGTANVERLASVVLKNIAQPIVIDGLELVVHASIGIALYPDDGNAGAQLVRNADTAMYRAKKQKLGYVLYGAGKAAG